MKIGLPLLVCVFGLLVGCAHSPSRHVQPAHLDPQEAAYVALDAFHKLPAPNGQTFVVAPKFKEDLHSLEFDSFAAVLTKGLETHGLFHGQATNADWLILLNCRHLESKEPLMFGQTYVVQRYRVGIEIHDWSLMRAQIDSSLFTVVH